MIKSYKKVIFLFSFLMTVNFCTPVFASFFQSEHGFSESQITSLFAVFSLSVFIFEIPTGLISDRIGEKKSLIIGTALIGISTILFIVGNKSLLYFGEIIYGIGSTFYSGPFESLVYKYCKNIDDNLDYDKIISKVYSLQWAALGFSFIGCFFLTKYGNVRFPFVATLAANILLYITSFFLPLTKKDKEQNINTFSIMKGFMNDFYLNRNLRTGCILNIFFSMVLVSGYQILQPYLLESSVPKSYNGLIYFIAAIFASCGSFFYEKLQTIFKSRKILLLVCMFFISACFFELAIAKGVLFIFIFVSIYRLVWGIASPMFASMINQGIENDDYRNTAFSMISLGSNMSSSVLLFAFAIMKLGPKNNFIILGILSSILFAIFAVVKKFVN